MRRLPLLLLALAAALVVVLLVRRAQSDRTTPAPAAVAASAPIEPAAAPRTTTPAEAPRDPRAGALLAALEELLARADVRAREALLTFKDDAAFQRFLSRAQKSGLAILGQADGLRTVRVRLDRFAALQNELLQNAADYAAVGANFLVGIPEPPAKENRAPIDQVPFGNDTLRFLGATGDRSQWGNGTTIAILDTGVAADATFGTGRLRALDVGFGLAPGNGREDGHGTAVAALAAGVAPDAPGVAPAANLLSIRVTDANGTSDIFTLAQAIVTAVDAGARIVNVSLGGYGTNAAMDAALAYATNRGAVVVAAAGNDQAAQLAWPAADPRVISVGAVDKAEQQVSFSNSGPQLQLSAPGYGVQTAWLNGQRAYVDGTSVSSPIVAGAIAAVMSQNPTLTPLQAAQLLERTASDAGAPGADPAFGNGILNLGWAMNNASPGYVDTAVSSHYFDATGDQLEFVVQNRSAQAVSGLTLKITAGNSESTRLLPLLTPGQSYVVGWPNATALATAAGGSVRFSTELVNPPGLNDKVPANNRRASVLTAPTAK
jgi:hypothetical protein